MSEQITDPERIGIPLRAQERTALLIAENHAPVKIDRVDPYRLCLSDFSVSDPGGVRQMTDCVRWIDPMISSADLFDNS